MLNHVSNEAFHSAMYVDNYLDAMENLPDEIQRLITRIRELDVKHRSCLRDVDTFYEQWANCSSNELLEGSNATKRNRAMTRIQQSLIAAQEIGDEKIIIVTQLTELIETKTRKLEQNSINLDYGKGEQLLPDIGYKDIKSQTPPYPIASGTLPSTYVTSSLNTSNTLSSIINLNQAGNGNNDRGTKRIRRGRADIIVQPDSEIGELLTKQELCAKQSIVTHNNTLVHKKNSNLSASTKKKRKKTGRQSNQGRENRDETPPIEEAIDPDEPTYCLCDQISFGEMILCDNDLCPIEWFHFSCVSLMVKPKGKWFCPNCRGDRPNTMKPKAQFLKELERYNKEKEEKT